MNGVVQSFLREVELEKVQTLDQFNHWFEAWLSECHQNKPHSALPDNQTPEVAFKSDTTMLRFAQPDLLANAFLHCESRKVDKAGCISFMGKKYEVGLLFIGRKVDVIYDPADVTEITIEYEGYTPWKARELVIGEHAGKRPALPSHLGRMPADASRLLRGAAQKQDERQEYQAPAITYRVVRKEADSDV